MAAASTSPSDKCMANKDALHAKGNGIAGPHVFKALHEAQAGILARPTPCCSWRHYSLAKGSSGVSSLPSSVCLKQQNGRAECSTKTSLTRCLNAVK